MAREERLKLRGLRLSPADWAHVVRELGFPPQQARIVELMLDCKKDKQIATEMGLGVPTVRTYLTRLFERTGSADRVELLLRVFACVYSRHDRCATKE